MFLNPVVRRIELKGSVALSQSLFRISILLCPKDLWILPRTRVPTTTHNTSRQEVATSARVGRRVRQGTAQVSFELAPLVGLVIFFIILSPLDERGEMASAFPCRALTMARPSRRPELGELVLGRSLFYQNLP